MAALLDDALQSLSGTKYRGAGRRISQAIELLATTASDRSTTSCSIEPHLPPRMRQTLLHLLHGDSEKQVAIKLGLSHHTVHVYVKSLYRHFGVSSRGELMARYIKMQ